MGIMFADHPEAIYAVRKDSPMIVGKNDKGCFIASDVPAILKYTRTVYYVDNQEVVELKKEGMCLDVYKRQVEKEGIDLVANWGTDAYKYEDHIYTLPCGGLKYFVSINMTCLLYTSQFRSHCALRGTETAGIREHAEGWRAAPAALERIIRR